MNSASGEFLVSIGVAALLWACPREMVLSWLRRAAAKARPAPAAEPVVNTISLVALSRYMECSLAPCHLSRMCRTAI